MTHLRELENAINKKVLYPELSYEIQGALFTIANSYGQGLKEIIYQNALAEEFTKRKLSFKEQKRINVYSLETGKILGVYIPDFIVENKIIIEIKATEFPAKRDVDQLRSYLRASEYEVAYLVNFCAQELFIKRSVYTNNRKPFIHKNS